MSASSSTKPSLITQIGQALGLAAWVVTGLLGLSSFVIVGLVLALPQQAAAYLTERTIGQLLLNAIMYSVALLIVIGVPYWFVRYVLKRPREEGKLRRVLGIDKPFEARNLIWLVFCIAGYFVATLIFSSLATLLPWVDANQKQQIGFENLHGASDLILAFVALVVLPPVAEELLFRGYLFGKLREQSGFWFSAIFTSLIFGIVHRQWNVGIDVFVLSMFLCFLREKTGSIWTGMLLHGFKNGVAYFFLFVAPLLGIHIS